MAHCRAFPRGLAKAPDRTKRATKTTPKCLRLLRPLILLKNVIFFTRSSLSIVYTYSTFIQNKTTVASTTGQEVEAKKLEPAEEGAERRKAEEQTKRLQEYLQLVVDRMPIGLIVWDKEFRIKTWNPAATRIFGFKEKEVLGKHPYDLIVPKEAQPHVDDIWRRLLEGDETAHSINENTTKDGQTIICSWSNTPLKKVDGTVVGVLSMVQDITERKRAEDRAKELIYELMGIEPGVSYLCESLERSMKACLNLSLHDVPVLYIVREDPEDLVKSYDIKPKNIIILSSVPMKGFKVMSDLQELSHAISQFIKAGGRVVLLNGLEYLISRFGFDTVYRMLQDKRFDFLKTNAILLAPVNLETLEERQRAQLRSELKILK